MFINRFHFAPLAAGAACALLAACSSNGGGQQPEQQAPELAVITIGAENATLETGYPATLHGQNDVEIRPQISGFITKVHVEEGQSVRKGQVLFSIDQVQLQAAVDAAQAAVSVAQANVNTATTNANNNKMLLDQNIISASAYQTSADVLAAAQAQLNQAKANLVSARKNLSYSSVTAPSAGVVGTIDFKNGALVTPQSLLTVLSANSDMEAYFSLNEKELLQLTADGTRSVDAAIAAMPEVSLMLADGSTYGYKGKVTSISGVLNSATGSATAKALFPNPNGVLRTGSTGRVLIPELTVDAILVPQKATYDIQDMKFCYVVGDSSKVHAVPITVAPNNDGQNYIVTGGLKAGDVVVIEGVGISLQDGMAIRPKSATATTAAAPAAAKAPNSEKK